MANYIDGFVLPIRRDQVDEYKRIAHKAAVIWKEHGALDYWECVGDDLKSEHTRTFTDMANATDEETVIFAWAVFASREARDAANEKIMADPRMTDIMNVCNSIFDCQRMAHGGFKELVHG